MHASSSPFLDSLNSRLSGWGFLALNNYCVRQIDKKKRIYLSINYRNIGIVIWISKTYPPVRDQSQTLHLFFAGIFLFVGAQNHPLMMVGIRSFLSQPLKLHFRPPVQIYGISSRLLQKMLSNHA